MFGNSKQVIGLDIGASSIKVVQLAQSKKGTELKTFGVLPLAPEVIVDGAIMDAEVVVDTIKQAVKEFKAKGKYAAISVAGHSVIVKKIIVADMSRQELEGAIETEAQQYIPFDIEDVNVDFQILEATENVNQNQKVILVSEIEKYFGGNLQGKKIALWGLAFKANTDDIREASSLDNIKILLEKGAEITAYDSIAEENVHRILGDKISYAKDMYSALENADCLLIATEWSEFKNPNFKLMAAKMNNKAIFDGRNMFALEQVENSGFYYKSIGRKTVK